MRLTLLSLGLAGVLAVPLLQDEEPATRPPGFTGYREAEKARLDEEITGTWTLLELRKPGQVLRRNQYAGFAAFQNGYFHLMLELDTLDRGILITRPATVVQAGVHRYRVTGAGRLQTATVMGFTNDNPDFELEREPSAYPREFQVTLKDDVLSLRRWDDFELVFRRTGDSGAFPKRAADALERYRGRNFEVPDDWNERR